jgi:glycosyltransferase involved in cell wall biosynthesis
MDVHDFEVVIVDNGSTDDTWQVLRGLIEASTLQIRALRNEPGNGPAAGRNRAWRDARAPLCAFTDDDCMPASGWLAAAVEGVEGRAVIAAGRVVWPQSDEGLMGPFSRRVTAPEAHAQWGATANLIVRRVDLEAVGGFDEGFHNVAGEDTDLLLRILEHGVDYTFLFDALVYHPIEPGGLPTLIRDQGRWADIPAVFAKHPWAREMLLYRKYFWRPTHPRAILALLGLAATPVAPLAGLLAAAPWVHERLHRQPLADTAAERIVTLPGALALDLVEVATMIRGSIRHKALVL